MSVERVLLIINENKLLRAIKVSIDLSFDCELSIATSSKEALKTLKDSEFDFEVIIYQAQNYDYELEDIIGHLDKINYDTRLVIIEENENSVKKNTLIKHRSIEAYSREYYLKNFSNIMNELIGLFPDEKLYRRIEINSLEYIDGLQNDIFIKNEKSGKYTSLFRKGSLLNQDEISQYLSRGINHVYIKMDKVVEIQNQVESQLNVFANFSGFKFVLRGSDEAMNKKYEQKIIRFQDMIILDRQFQAQIETAINKTISMIQKLPTIYNLLKKTQEKQNKDNYFTEHMLLLCYVTNSWAHRLGWHSKGTKDKLIFASILHDITLAGAPHLAKFKSLEEFEKTQQNLSLEDKTLFLNHSLEAATIVEHNFPVAPCDTANIILQHHEHPNAQGFPNKLDQSKISPLSALFILAHEFVDRFIQDDLYNEQKFFHEAKLDFSKSSFKKLIKTLEDKVDKKTKVAA